MQRDDFLVEIHTEELPPKALLNLAESFCQNIKEAINKAELTYSEINFFATPRRLAVFIKELVETQPDQQVERRGPAINAAYDKNGQPTQALIGFARSCGVTPNELQAIKTSQGEWIGYKQIIPGKTVFELLPGLINQAVVALPIPKRMHWGDSDIQFVRPVHSVILLYGDKVVDATVLGCKAGRITRGHRFLAPGWLTIAHAAAYASILATEGKVIVDFFKRKETIRQLAKACVDKKEDMTRSRGQAAGRRVFISSEKFLNEVTGLVEYPVALCGQFDENFLDLPSEVLISSMEDHQRYFPVTDAQGRLLANFIVISNIDSHDARSVIHGNERVLRARLADAAFFFTTDKNEGFTPWIERLNGMLFQAKLGTLFEKAERLSQLTAFIAKHLHLPIEQAKRAGWLAKADLASSMVGEFPELQGIMGSYYADLSGEAKDIAVAIKEQYLPRFAGGGLPQNALGQALAIADRIDILVGTFGINYTPTGDKDPFGLRRAAIGIIRIIIENKLNLDLYDLIKFAISLYKERLENPHTSSQVLAFIQERLRSWYQEHGVSTDVFAAVAAINVTNLIDMDARIRAVQGFKRMAEAETLSIANKRVSNILSKYTDDIAASAINPQIFENQAEQELAQQLETKSQIVERLSKSGQYDEVLLQLTQLRKPIDDFFDQVMVMTDDKSRRENRILLLSKLRALFLQVADIALLQ